LALDENIYEIRREKLKKIEALGHPAYPRKYNYSHTVAQILAEYGGQTRRN
jgi:lysyl-tRNA synthetase class II